jgi:hypothetical protein
MGANISRWTYTAEAVLCFSITEDKIASSQYLISIVTDVIPMCYAISRAHKRTN